MLRFSKHEHLCRSPFESLRVAAKSPQRVFMAVPFFYAGVRLLAGVRNKKRAGRNPNPLLESTPSELPLEPLHVQVAHALGVGLDEGLARRHLVAHEQLEDAVRLDGVLHLHLQQRPAHRVHRSVP